MIKATEFGQCLREARQRHGLSLRALALKSGVAVSFLSKIEAGRGSPTLATLLKLLEALDTSPPEFFAGPAAAEGDVIVQRQADMQVLDDGDRRWRYLFPNRRVVKAIMTYEEYRPKTRQVVTEKHPADVCGVVLAGTLTLAVSGQAPVTVGAGDSFYIRAGIPHTAANLGAEPLRLVVVELPHTRATPLVHGGLTASAGAGAEPPATARRRLRGGREGRRSSSR